MIENFYWSLWTKKPQTQEQTGFVHRAEISNADFCYKTAAANAAKIVKIVWAMPLCYFAERAVILATWRFDDLMKRKTAFM